MRFSMNKNIFIDSNWKWSQGDFSLKKEDDIPMSILTNEKTDQE